MTEDISFQDLIGRFQQRVRDALDGTGNFGFKSYGMKSRLMPRLGLIKTVYDQKAAAASWEEYKRTRNDQEGDREERESCTKITAKSTT
jgi:uncharacterized protein